MREMKNSGVEWIGKIPKEWSIVKFKYLHNGLNTGEAIDKEYWESDAGLNAFYTAGLTPIRTGYSNFPTWKETRENDLLLARNGTPYVYLPVSKAYYTDHIIRAAMSSLVNRRFIRYAIERNVEEIYVTLYMNRPELRTLYDLLVRWGFYEYGIKRNDNGEEVVLVKKMAGYDKSKSVKENFPNIRYDVQKFFLPIEAQYHTPLFPDSQLRTEGNFDYLGDKAHRYALQKVYISLSYKRDMRPGDLLVIYRKGITPRRKAYESVVSTICVVDEVRYNFSSKEDYLKYCENRTVFSPETLNQLWEKHSEKLLVVKFIFIKSLTKRITLGELWSSGIIPQYSGPRPFDHISDADFDTILAKSKTKIHFERQ